MSFVYKCDRCGQEIDKIFDSKPKIVFRAKQVDLFLRDIEKTYSFDLCPACANKILDWVNGKNTL